MWIKRSVVMAVDRRAGLRASASLLFCLAPLLAYSSAQQASAQAPAKAKSVDGFGDPRRGDVPEGTALMMTPETDVAIMRGLAWLARSQSADGSFGAGAYRGNIAVTSLAGLAFMASGSSPGRGPYGAQIDKALAYVMQNTSPSGFIAVAASTHGPMYSHGFGTLFLAEAYGMAHRPEIREKLQKAVRLIIDCQNIEGGWRYQPVKHDADLSVTICQINALRAARNAGLFVPKDTVDACIRYVKQSQNPDGGFRYMLQAGATSEFPRSAAGVVALQSAGEYDSREVKDGIAFLRQARRGLRSGRRNNHFFYGQYYAGQAMWLQGGDAWAEWYPAIRGELLLRQTASGFWPDSSVCNEYGTAMALIILQIPNDYLPIFQR
jgi:hypothetical protein